MKSKIAACVVAACAVLLGACSSSQPARHDQSGVSDALLGDSAQFQRPEGLFVMPEGAAVPVPHFEATAQFVSAVGPAGLSVLDWPRIRSLPAPQSPDLVSADAFLQVRSAAAGPRLAPADAARLARAIVLPDQQGDTGAEIGALWTWADARALLTSLGGPALPAGDATRRVTGIDPAALAGHPYLVTRLAEVYARLGLARPPVLTALLQRVADAPVPPPDSLPGVLDALAIVRERTSHQVPPGITADYVTTAQRVLDSGRAEDLAQAGLLAILRDTGNASAARTYVSSLRTRVSPSTGLISTASTSGTVDATYLFSRLLDVRFGEVASTATKDRLYSAATDANAPLVTRLRAAAALRRAGDDRWKNVSAALLGAASRQPSTIQQDDLGTYLDVMEPAAQLDQTIRKSALQAFDPGADEVEQREAVSALSLSYLFSNEDAVGAMFPAVQKKLRTWLDSPSTNFPVLVAAAAALPASRVVQLDSAQMDKTAARITARQGCDSAKTFFAVDGSGHGTCSLLLTLQARSVPGVVS